MKLLSVEMACLFGVQNHIQAVCGHEYLINVLLLLQSFNQNFKKVSYQIETKFQMMQPDFQKIKKCAHF